MAKANKKSAKKASETFHNIMKASVGSPLYYYSENEKKDSISIKTVAAVLEDYYEPYYYIKFITTKGAKLKWGYTSKKLRDKEIKEIRELK